MIEKQRGEEFAERREKKKKQAEEEEEARKKREEERKSKVGLLFYEWGHMYIFLNVALLRFPIPPRSGIYIVHTDYSPPPSFEIQFFPRQIFWVYSLFFNVIFLIFFFPLFIFFH